MTPSFAITALSAGAKWFYTMITRWVLTPVEIRSEVISLLLSIVLVFNTLPQAGGGSVSATLSKPRECQRKFASTFATDWRTKVQIVM